MDLDDVLERSGLIDDPPRCGAQAKTTGKSCKQRPLPGGKRCKFHGGKQSRKPNALAKTHGTTTKYIEVSKLPDLLARIDELRTPEGKERALLGGAALMQQRVAAVPDNPDYIDKVAQALKSIREDIKVSHEIAKVDVAPTAHTFVIATGNAQAERFEARSPEGHCTIRMLDGEPFMLVRGDWLRCVKGVDEDSGAEVYRRVLELEG
jgi:hypothetical protein